MDNKLKVFYELKSSNANEISDLHCLAQVFNNHEVCDLEQLPDSKRLEELESDIYYFVTPDIAEDFGECNEGNPILELFRIENLIGSLESMLPIRQDVSYL